MGYHYFVTRRLAERVGSNARIRDGLWRLAIPYTLPEDTRFADILFPVIHEDEAEDPSRTDKSPLEQLVELGILKWDYEAGSPYRLHLTTRMVLSETAPPCREEIVRIHRELENYFQEKKVERAAHYHRLCGNKRSRFEDLGITPEKYWELVSCSISLDEKKRNSFRFKKLPQKRALKNRVEKLTREWNGLGMGAFCGDATLFLRQKFREESLTLEQLDEKSVLQDLIKEEKNLSDLRYKLAMVETDPEERYRILVKTTDEINHAHAHAWWERAELEKAQGSREEAHRSFNNALDYGVTGFYRDYATGHAAWM